MCKPEQKVKLTELARGTPCRKAPNRTSKQPYLWSRMSVKFSGWEVIDDGASFPGVKLEASQKPQNRGVYTMYHGTSLASARLIIANGFRPSAGGTLGAGVYVSRDQKKASSYPAFCTDRVIFELRVRVGRVKRIDSLAHPLRTTWHASGYNTAWLPASASMVGQEEDCVHDPKRVEIIGIAVAPDAATQSELKQLIAKNSKKKANKGGKPPELCALCKRKTQEGATHTKQKCWSCGKNICILAPKHFCASKP